MASGKKKRWSRGPSVAAGFVLILIGSILMGFMVGYLFWAPENMAGGLAGDARLFWSPCGGGARATCGGGAATRLDVTAMWVQGTVIASLVFVGGLALALVGGFLAKSIPEDAVEEIDPDEHRQVRDELEDERRKNASLRNQLNDVQEQLERAKKAMAQTAEEAQEPGGKRSRERFCYEKEES